MKCAQAQQQLSLMIDGELGADARQELQLHLDQCASCRSEAAELSALRAAFVAPARRIPSTAILQRLRERIHAEDAIAAREQLGNGILLSLREALFGRGAIAVSMALAAMLFVGQFLGSHLWDTLLGSQTAETEVSSLLGQDTADESISSVYQDIFQG